MNTLVPWIAVFFVFLGLSFVGMYFQRTEKARRELSKKLSNAANPAVSAQAMPASRTSDKLGRYGTEEKQTRVDLPN